MCGISGILSKTEKKEDMVKKINKMNIILNHRGPDDKGVWIDNNIILGHTRLSIIDLNVRSKQPMVYEDNYIITYNGEVYNYDILKKQLKDYKFYTNSDTEVILAMYKKYGKECIQYLDGMFSFALWDKKKKELFCARDRLGIKPFYYFYENNNFYFASEIKALLPYISKVDEDLEGIGEYLIFQYPISQNTMFKNIKQLMPGTYLTFSFDNHINIEKYWELDYTNKVNDSKEEIMHNIRKLFDESIKLHLKSDVPVGSYISGGIDSGLISILSKKENKLDSSYHGRFTDYEGFDESKYAEIISNKIDISLNIMDISCEDFEKNIKNILYYLDYPIVGPGSFPQFMVSKLVSKNVKVILGGQGGDEIFCGYVRYLIPYFENIIYKTINGEPEELKHFLNKAEIIKQYIPMLKNFWKDGLFDDLRERYFKILDRSNVLDEIINWKVINKDKIKQKYNNIFDNKNISKDDYFNKMLDFDLKYCLPALLQVEDRMSMAWGVESRVPIINHKLIEYVAKIPENMKIEKGNPKSLLKNSFKENIPEEIINRKDKMGFPVPLNNWFNGKLRNFIIDIIRKLKARNLSYMNITDKFMDDLKNTTKFSRKIWILLSLELWYENYFD